MINVAHHFDDIERHSTAIECECHGYAAREEASPSREEDRAAGGCGRPGCCTAAFTCRLCGKRWIAALPAPEME
ncbi:hypothetical protein HOU00_gp296 [Caulobacter phage CcrPW]|uniref:Uncharacterized protein n=1 Tax=Caulobacter phage CcrPW TaxID=2283271 RepID=A0A385EDQ8_9CAUD|nr:hypothetical protein HOU00_gp296 [Caulobacter phage CcrPW]AXQ68829.1 hypothetical protein CcrPW_gp290 [Caulobacter phage CcrPW]